jgi:hypothetical protein
MSKPMRAASLASSVARPCPQNGGRMA